MLVAQRQVKKNRAFQRIKEKRFESAILKIDADSNNDPPKPENEAERTARGFSLLHIGCGKTDDHRNQNQEKCDDMSHEATIRIVLDLKELQKEGRKKQSYYSETCFEDERECQ